MVHNPHVRSRTRRCRIVAATVFQIVSERAGTLWTMLREGDVVAKKVRVRTVVPREELLRAIDEAPAARAP